MHLLYWISLPVMLWILASPGFARESRNRSVASLTFLSSPPGSIRNCRSVAVRLRENTRQGLTLEYRRETHSPCRAARDLFRMGILFGISDSPWHLDLEGGMRVMNHKAGFILDHFKWMPIGLHVRFSGGRLEGFSFYDASISAGRCFGILEACIGYRACRTYRFITRGPFLGCCLWM